MHRNRWIRTLLVLALGIALGAGAAWTAERHPEIRAAQRSLHQAKTRLEHAAHDYAGHRVKAIGFIDNALEELQLALESDKN